MRRCSSESAKSIAASLADPAVDAPRPGRRCRGASPTPKVAARRSNPVSNQRAAIAGPLLLRFGLLDQRTTAGIERTERLLGRDRLDELVEVPRRLRFRRLLDLEQIHVAHQAAVDAQAAVLGHE